MNAYEIVLLVLIVLGLGIDLAKHGEMEIKKRNFWITLISTAINLFIMYQAGLFHW